MIFLGEMVKNFFLIFSKEHQYKISNSFGFKNTKIRIKYYPTPFFFHPLIRFFFFKKKSNFKKSANFHVFTFVSETQFLYEKSHTHTLQRRENLLNDINDVLYFLRNISSDI